MNCGNYTPGGDEIDLTDGSMEGAMTSTVVYISNETNMLVGVEYCEVPIESGISWRQYFDWVLQFKTAWVEGDWTLTAASDLTSPVSTDEFTKGPYITDFAAIETKSVPQIAYVKKYEKGGLCMGFDLIYWNYPGVTFSWTESAADGGLDSPSPDSV